MSSKRKFNDDASDKKPFKRRKLHPCPFLSSSSSYKGNYYGFNPFKSTTHISFSPFLSPTPPQQTSSDGLNPQQTLSYKFNFSTFPLTFPSPTSFPPQQTSSDGLNLQQTSSYKFNFSTFPSPTSFPPQQTSSDGLNLQQTSSDGFNPQQTTTGTFSPQHTTTMEDFDLDISFPMEDFDLDISLLEIDNFAQKIINQEYETISNNLKKMKQALNKKQFISVRDKKEKSIKSFLLNESNQFMLISGVPGVGKTMTVRNIAKNLKNRFLFCELNMSNITITANYKSFLKFFYNALLFKFGFIPQVYTVSDYFSYFDKPMILLMDEIDRFLDFKNCDKILYNLLDMCEKYNIKMIGISNVLNFRELLSQRIYSRFGNSLLYFENYTRQQLVDILKAYLVDSNCFTEDALICCCMSVACVSGDFREILNLCKNVIQEIIVQINDKIFYHSGDLQKFITKEIVLKKYREIKKNTIAMEYVESFPRYWKILLTILVSHSRKNPIQNDGVESHCLHGIFNRRIRFFLGAEKKSYSGFFLDMVNELCELDFLSINKKNHVELKVYFEEIRETLLEDDICAKIASLHT